MKTYKITFESNIGMFSHYYATKEFNANTEAEAREQAESWASTMPERDNVAIDRVTEVA